MWGKCVKPSVQLKIYTRPSDSRPLPSRFRMWLTVPERVMWWRWWLPVEILRKALRPSSLQRLWVIKKFGNIFYLCWLICNVILIGQWQMFNEALYFLKLWFNLINLPFDFTRSIFDNLYNLTSFVIIFFNTNLN